MTARRIALVVTTTLVFLAFAFSRIANVAHFPHIAHDMARLGYPAYFSSILGVWKILGAITVALPRFPRLKEWAYAGMIFDLTGAAISRAVVGDGAAGIVPPLLVASLVLASRSLRSTEEERMPS